MFQHTCAIFRKYTHETHRHETHTNTHKGTYIHTHTHDVAKIPSRRPCRSSQNRLGILSCDMQQVAGGSATSYLSDSVDRSLYVRLHLHLVCTAVLVVYWRVSLPTTNATVAAPILPPLGLLCCCAATCATVVFCFGFVFCLVRFGLVWFDSAPVPCALVQFSSIQCSSLFFSPLVCSLVLSFIFFVSVRHVFHRMRRRSFVLYGVLGVSSLPCKCGFRRHCTHLWHFSCFRVYPVCFPCFVFVDKGFPTPMRPYFPSL